MNDQNRLFRTQGDLLYIYICFIYLLQPTIQNVIQLTIYGERNNIYLNIKAK